MMRFLWTMAFFSVGLIALATHNRAGEILYEHVSGLEYKITIVTYSKTSVIADRPFLNISWGDGSSNDSVPRSLIFFIPSRDAQRNEYEVNHVFPGPGSYTMCVDDPNRNEGVLNISSSVMTMFAISTTLVIDPFTPPNNSVTMLFPPIQDGCTFQPWIYNPAAFDQDGDSLSFSLVTPIGAECAELNNFVPPSQVPASGNNTITIDPLTGTIIWDRPEVVGEYNLAIRVEEWRNGRFRGAVIRDMQIFISPCNNRPPEIIQPNDTCIEAGQTLLMEIQATDPDGDNVTLGAFGGPFVQASSPAVFNQTSMSLPATGQLTWATNCTHVQLLPYQVVIVAQDNTAAGSLGNVSTFNITVVAPAPEVVSAEPLGSQIMLEWLPSVCANAAGYKVYRRAGLYGFDPDVCETGVPAYTGYSLIATIPGQGNTSLIDNNDVNYGTNYCYMVVAYFADGAESYASEEICASLRRELPIITKVSIGNTALTTGRDTLQWAHPTELDTLVQFPGPYTYRVLRGVGGANPATIVYESPTEAQLYLLPTELISEGINTVDGNVAYRVELRHQNEFLAVSNRASSVFLSAEPNDNQLGLSWTANVPWVNYSHEIYRRGPGETEFSFIAETDTAYYVDQGIRNNTEYCYFVVSEGSYFGNDLPDPIFNTSQQICDRPFDFTPPCPPVLSESNDCIDLWVDLGWTNPNEACEDTDDTMAYHVWYAPTPNDPFEIIATLEPAENTSYEYLSDLSIAGCYAITALDSIMPGPDGELRQNESQFSNVVCIDNCPEYLLPNVFTPNGDGRNDQMLPLRMRSIESVDFKVYSRWGMLLFETNDPMLNWDGTDRITGQVVSDGTYFYTCRVYTIRLEGIVPIDLSGYVQVFTSTAPQQN